MAKLPAELFIIGNLIERGQVAQARQAVRALNPKDFSRNIQVEIASFARRVNLPGLALRFLYPIVRSSRPLAKPASVEEIAEYATNLVRFGGTVEAELLLDKFSDQPAPCVQFAKIAVLFSQWRYGEAIPVLESYTQRDEVSSYKKLIGKVNLLAANVFEDRIDEAKHLIDELLETTRKSKQGLLYGNTLELAAQWAISSKDYIAAARYLNQAKKVLLGTGLLDSFFVEKWECFLAASQEEGGASKQRIEALRLRAMELSHWETVRDCDRFVALGNHDSELYTQLYFGTPYEGFREKLSASFSDVQLPQCFDWMLGKQTGPILDLTAGERAVLKAGQMNYKVILALCSDFYRPIALANLYCHVYPGEYFNPETSPNRLHQNLTRLKRWFQKQKAPLDIERTQNAYRIVSSGCVLRLPIREGAQATKEDWQLGRLQKHWKTRAFTLKQVQSQLEVSLSSCQRLIEYAMKNGQILREGKGRSTSYRFVA